MELHVGKFSKLLLQIDSETLISKVKLITTVKMYWNNSSKMCI